MYTFEHNSPIITTITGVENPSRNRKTGHMLQFFTIRDDMHPMEASRTGADEAICGKCPLRGEAGKKRACYVTLAHAPQAVYKGIAKSKPMDWRVLVGQSLRFGAYGDPAFISLPHLDRATRVARNWTGYTHQWKSCDPEYRRYLMASVETEEDRELAKSAGWRTFRVRSHDQPVSRGETICPASDEAGKLLTCQTCGMCNGASNRNDITIIAHGRGKGFL